MTNEHPGDSSAADSADSADSLGSPEHDLSGPTIDEAVAKAEAGSEVDTAHTTSAQAPSGESRLERFGDEVRFTQMTADGDTEASATPPEPGPSPTDTGSGGAQRVVGARISDRVSGGVPAPDGPPFDTDADADTGR